MYMFQEKEAEVLEMNDEISIKIKEFGKPIFKSKGKKKCVKKEVEDFWSQKYGN